MKAHITHSRKIRASVGAPLAIGAAVVAIAGCGGSSSTSAVASSASKTPATEVPSAEITRAADVSSAVRGFKVALEFHETVGSTAINATGTGSFDTRPTSGSLNLNMNLPGAALGNMQIQTVVTPGAIYMKYPAAIAGELPGAKPWLELNLKELGKAASLPGLGSLTESTNETANPGMYLDFLRATSEGGVKDLGQATVNGIQTTHYRATVDLNKLESTVPAADRKGVEQLLSTLTNKGAMTQLPIDAWIDSSNRVRRIALAYGITASGQTVHLSMQVDFTQFGPQPLPLIPNPSETTDLVSLLQSAGALTGASSTTTTP